MLPYKYSLHSAKCVRCAPLRSEGAADWRPGPRWSILSMLCPVHPFPLRGTSPRWEACHWIFRSLRSLTNPVPLPPQGETRALRNWLFMSYGMTSILVIGSLRSPPPIRLRRTSPAVRSVNRKEGPFMGRLRAYFDRLAHPMQDVHRGRIKLTHSEE